MQRNKGELDMLSDFYKNNPEDKIWWVEDIGSVGQFLFSFDKKEVFNLFSDYPYKLTPEQKALFDEENPYWADFFKDRQTQAYDMYPESWTHSLAN